MRLKTIVSGFSFAVLVFLLAYFLGVGIAFYSIAILFIIEGFTILYSKKTAEKLGKFINYDRWEAVNRKDDEFKSHLKKNALGYIIVGIVIGYIGYRLNKFDADIVRIRLSISLPIFILIYFFGETISVLKSKNIDQYRRLNIVVAVLLMFVATVII
jgi:preprotein translocase subunit Sss1